MPLPEAVELVGRRLIRDEVYATLRQWIVAGVLAPGEKLADQEVASHLGVSRTPVREALRRLEDEKLVETARNRWTRVVAINVDEAEHLYPMVSVLEALATRLAGARLEIELDALTAANDQLAEALDFGDSVAAAKADAAFHHLLVARSENPYLTAAVDGLKVRLRRLEILYFEGSSQGRVSIAEHERILDAVREGDAERASEAVVANWRGSLDRFRRHARQHRTLRPASSVIS